MQQLRVTYVAGVVPGKWIDRFAQRYPQVELVAERLDEGDVLARLADGRADVVFVRYPVDASPKDQTRHVIPLYQELEVICAAREHDVEYYDDSIPEADAAGFAALDLTDYPEERGGLPMALEVVASGAFVARMPMSLARLHARKDVIYRVIEGGTPTQVGIAWPVDTEKAELVDEFIGVVRGRSASSSRQASVREREQRASGAKPRGAKSSGAKPAARQARPGRSPKGRRRR